jgi:NTP pyrophosphatase (non-canonical NTP hydrolase)
MTFDQYVRLSEETSVYPNSGEAVGLAYAALGLAGETGEIVNKIKKVLRKDVTDYKSMYSEFRKELAKEIGDALWYMAALCREIDCSMSEIALNNLDKLQDRKNRGVLRGSGDNR